MKVSNVKDDTEIWNEDGIYEFDNQKDFEELIGFEGTKSQAIGAVACEPENEDDDPLTFEDDADPEAEDYKTAKEKFEEYLSQLAQETIPGHLYLQESNADGVGHLRDDMFKYKRVDE